MQVKWQQIVRLIVLSASLLLLTLSLSYVSRSQIARAALPPAGVTKIFGIDEGGVLSSSDAASEQAAATGAKWVRTEISWAALEATPGVYNFTYAEPIINRFVDAGLTPVVYFARNPPWAANTICGPVDTNDPAKVAAFGNAIGALAAHFPQVKIWALYNEVDQSTPPDSIGAGCFGSYSQSGVNNNGVKDSKEYAIMLAAAYKAVHDANPNAKLATGSVAFDNFDETSAPNGYPGGGAGGKFNYKFLNGVFKYMKKHPENSYFDMLLFNYYDIYGRYWESKYDGFGIQAKVDALRKKMTAKQLTVTPFFVSETGEESLTLGLKTQARCLDMVMVRGAAVKLKGIVWWTFKDFPDSNPSPSNTWKYGIVDQAFQPKPSYTAYQTLATELNGYRLKGNYSYAPGFDGLESYRFKKGSSLKFVVWSATYTPPPPPLLYNPQCSWVRTGKLATFDATTLRIVDYLGKTKIIADNSGKDKDPTVGKIAIKIRSAPKIVEINP